MSKERPYLQHGRRHGIFGSDSAQNTPVSYIAGSTGGITLGSTATFTEVDLNPASISWGTEQGANTSSDYFDLRDPGSGKYEIALLANGLYVIDVAADFDISTPAPSAGAIASILLGNTATRIGGTFASLWVATGVSPSHSANPSIRAMLNWPEGVGTPPIYHPISISQNSGATITNIEVGFMVTLLNYGNTGF